MLVLSSLAVGCALVLRIRRPHLFSALRWSKPPEVYTVPVAGVSAADLVSTWHAPRTGGRKHEGADIFAPKGTPVVSATDGVVWKIANGGLGGKSVTVLGEGPAFYYYAHLDDWALGLKTGTTVHRAEPLGFVGNTGNAKRTRSHLHFGVYRISLRNGVRAVDPVPLLAGAQTAF